MDPTAQVYGCLEGYLFGADTQAKLQYVHQLEAMNASPAEGYVSCLVHIVQASQPGSGVRLECRQLAAVSLKNVVDKCWVQRSAAVSAIGDAEKAALKEFALAYLLEPDRKVAVQLAVITAKVATKDWFQGQWPQLFPALFEAISSPCAKSPELTWLQHVRAMSALDCVLEELSRKRMPGQQKALLEVCGQCFPHLQGLWQGQLTQLLPSLQYVQSSAAAGGGVARNRLNERLCQHLAVTTRALCKVAELGFKALATQGARAGAALLGDFFQSIAAQVPALLQFLRAGRAAMLASGTDGGGEDGDGDDSGYENDSGGAGSEEEFIDARNRSGGGGGGGAGAMQGLGALVPSVRRVVRDVARLPAALLKQHPLSMAPFVEPFLHFYYAQLVDEHGSAGPATSQALSVSSVLFLSSALQCAEYSDAGASSAGADALRTRERARDKLSSLLAGGSGSAIDDEAVAAAANYAASQGAAAKRAFFSPDRMAALLDLLLCRLLRYSPSELEEWDTSPELFSTAQEEMLEKDSVKCAGEGLVAAMIDESVSPCAAEVQMRLVAHLQNVPLLIEAVQPGAPEDTVFFWDAVFLCTGLGSYTLGSRINADEWLAKVLGPLLPALFASPACGALHGGQQLLRARLLWLIKSWLYLFDPQVRTCL